MVISATNGKTTTAAMAASILERARDLARPQPGRGQHGGRDRLDAPGGSPAPAAEIDGELGLFEVDEFWLDRITSELEPRAVLLGNLFRDQLDRYGELETIADRWAAVVAALPASTRLVLNADDPLIADLGRELGDVTYFGVEDRVGGARRDAACLGLQALPPLRRRLCLRGDLPRTSRTLPLSLPAARSARRPLWPRSKSSSTAPERRDSGCAPRRAARRWRFPCRVSTTSTTRSEPQRCACSWGSRWPDVAAGLQAVTAAFGRAETVPVDGVELSILLVKNPAGANEILRTLVLEDGELDVLAILNDRTADGKDVSWVWDADFEILAARVRHVTCAGTRAAELALRLKYAGVPESIVCRWCRASPAALDAAAGRSAGEPPVRAADVHRAAGAARRARRPRARRAVLGARASRRG